MTTQLKGAKSFLICNSFFLLSFLFLNFSNLEAKTFTVTNTNDSGLGSFRQAILDANAKPGKDKIEFDIPGSGPHTIKPNSALPTITDRVTIDGYSQSGAKPNRNRPGKRNNAKLKIVLNGSNVPGFTSGLHITAGKCKIRGLVIHSFSLGIFIENKGENDIEGNFIGTDVTGTDGPGNGANGLEIKGSGVKNNKVKNNVISGNGVNGILIWQGASKNRVLRNIIGAGVNGDEELGNGGNGVSMESASNNKVGGNSKKDRNLIANNETHGVLIKGASARKNRVQGNYIGADRTGKNSNGNQGDGIAIEDAPDNLIGGKKKNRGNLISGNNSDGIRIEGNDAHDNVVQGNFIGTDVQGRNAIPNDNGITLDNQCENNTVGGIRRRARNLISGNENNGIFIGVDAENNVIQGNYIGTDISGRAALGNDFAGIEIISGNNNEIGGTRRRARNIIAFNEAGVLVASGTGNAILANSIFNNNGLGIDLAEDGVTPNDPGDTDAGANNLQNFPLLTSAVIDNGKTKVAGAIDTQNPEDITLEFFANKNSDPSGHGEGQKFLGTATPNSLGEFEKKLPKVKSGTFISATATDKDGNTSEFSANIEALKPGQLTKPIVAEETQAIPESFGLSHNYPNPFNPETRIEFQLPEASQVIIRIYNMLGQEVRILVDEPYQAGYHSVRWDGKDSAGRNVASGVYLYRIAAGGFTDVKKMSLLR